MSLLAAMGVTLGVLVVFMILAWFVGLVRRDASVVTLSGS